MALLHFLGQGNQNVVQHDFLGHVMPLPQHWHHMMLMALKMASLHSFGKYDDKKVEHDVFVHMMLLVLVFASYGDDDGIFSGTSAFLSPRWLKWVTTWLFQSCDTWYLWGWEDLNFKNAMVPLKVLLASCVTDAGIMPVLAPKSHDT